LELKRFAFIPGSLQALRLLNERGFEAHVISNQGCVSRKLITLKGLRQITEHMTRGIRRAGGRLTGVHYCFHQSSDGCACKKPKTGLFKKAAGKRRIRWSGVYFIGDSPEDIEAGKRIGCKTVLVLSGRMKRKDVLALPEAPDRVEKNLLAAARWILKQERVSNGKAGSR